MIIVESIWGCTDFVSTFNEKEQAKKFLIEFQNLIVHVDKLLSFLPTDEIEVKICEEIANKFYECAKKLKDQGVKIMTTQFVRSISSIRVKRRNFETIIKLKPAIESQALII